MSSFQVMAPWLRWDGNPKRAIAALELLGTMIAVKLWAAKDCGRLLASCHVSGQVPSCLSLSVIFHVSDLLCCGMS